MNYFQNLKSLKGIASELTLLNLEKESSVNTLYSIDDDFNVSVDNNKIHSKRYPEQEAQRIVDNWIDSTIISEDTIVTVNGLAGLYHIKELLSRLSKKNTLIVIDTEPGHLKNLCDLCDLSYLSESSVNIKFFVSSDLNEIIYDYCKFLLDNASIEKVHQIDVKFFMLPKLMKKSALEAKHSELLTLLLNKTKIIRKDTNLVTEYSLSAKYAINTVKNIQKMQQSQNIFPKYDFSGKTALIAGAGPSLLKTIEIIKNSRDKFILFSIGAALKVLLKNNIIPDIVVNADGKKVTIKQYPNEILNGNMILLATNNTHPEIIDKFKDKVIFCKANNNLNPELYNWLESKNIFLEPLNSIGSVISFAIDAAVKMKFKNIIITGLDLSFKSSNAIYAKSSKAENLKICDENLISIKGNWEPQVLTKPDYAEFAILLGYYFKNKRTENFYNITDSGAYIENLKAYRTTDLPLILRDVQNVKLKDYIKLTTRKVKKDNLSELKSEIEHIIKIAKNALIKAHSVEEFQTYHEKMKQNKYFDIFVKPNVAKSQILLNLTSNNQSESLSLFLLKQYFQEITSIKMQVFIS